MWLITNLFQHLTIEACTKTTLCWCWGGEQGGSGLFDTLPAEIWMWALTLPIFSCWRLRPQLCFSSEAGGWQRWQLRDLAECAETTEPHRWGRVVQGSTASASQPQKEISMSWSFPACAYRSLFWITAVSAICRKLCFSGRKLSGVSCGLFCLDHEVHKVKACVWARGREEGRYLVEPCCEWMVTPSTVSITCFGLLASLCLLENRA